MPAVRPSVLLVDDDPTLRSVLARRLGRDGFDVRPVSSGVEALRALDRAWPAILVIDLMMPGMDGFELCRRVKQIADLPIIVLSAVDESEAKVRALEYYAEDYVTKPFDPDELSARIHRILRRTESGRGGLTLDGGALEIDLVQRRARVDERTESLSPTEVRFLQVLIASLDRTVPTDTLLNRVWSDSEIPDPSYVWVTVRRLRNKIERDPSRPRVLLTDRGVGYRLSTVGAAGG
ncbi:MAG: response regulator transcription factor [Candidatus Limnocylindria bacterium]